MTVLVVKCESCGTQFRLDSARLTKPKNKVRCTRCGQVFLLDQPVEEDLVRIDLSEEDEMEEEAVEESLIPGSFTEESLAPPVPPPLEAKRSFPLRRALVLAVPALIIVGAVVLYSFNGLKPSVPIPSKMPQQSESAQSAVTIMDSLQAYFLENGHGGQMFVVEGEVKNISPNPVSFVLLEGKLYTAGHQVAQIQRCYLGNVMTRKEIAGLTVTEIQDRMMNREGKDLRNIRVPSNNRAPFVLVFHNLPELSSLGDYSVEVISSKID